LSDLLKLLRENAGEIAEKLGEGYLDDLVEKGHAAVNVAVTNDEDPLTAEGAKAAHDALDHLTENKHVFTGLSRLEFARLVAHWEDDDVAEAKRQYLERDATFEERRAAMHAAGDALVEIRKKREESWNKVAEVFKAIGKIGVKFAATAAIALLGL